MDERESEAYQEVLRRIRYAEETGTTELDLNVQSRGGLTFLPPEVGGLICVKRITLFGWLELSDLGPLSTLKGCSR